MIVKRVSKRHLDKLVVVDFLDHVMGGSDLLLCRVYGRVKSFDTSQVIISAWDTLNADGSYDEDNEETFTLAQSTIKNVKVLR